MIDEKKIKEAARIHATGNMLYECHKEAFEQGAKWALEQSQWISVVDALPQDAERVLLLFTSGKFEVGYFYREWQSDSTFTNIEQRGYSVSHWMPLPVKPLSEPPRQ